MGSADTYQVVEEDKYQQILEELKLKGCTLILGPEFCVMDKEETLLKSICDFIADNHLPGKPYISEDGFFYSNKSISNNFIDRKIKEFYRDLSNKETPSYYNLIAQIPFNFIISLSPDDFLHKALNENNRKHSFIYFKKGAELKELEEKELTREQLKNNPVEIYNKKTIRDISFDPSPENTLLFNLVGIYDDHDSLVVTHNALFEFLYSVFPPEEKLKNRLKKAITDSTSFLCLGFQYNKWYLKIIFFIIKKIFEKAEKEQVGKTAIFVSSNDSQKKAIDFYENQFKIVFTPQKTIHFIHSLYSLCDEEKLLTNNADLPTTSADTLLQRFKIVHVSSNPDSELSYLNYDSEFKRMETTWKLSPSRNKFELKRSGAVTQKDLLHIINEENPDLLIIAVHGKEELTLTFSDDHQQEAPLSLLDFLQGVELLTSRPDSRLKGIIFNCCHSVVYAREVAMVKGLVSFAVGMEGLIGDTVIPEFIEGFLSAYMKSKDFTYAYNMGIQFIRLNADPDIKAAASQPQLFSKK